MTLHFNGQSTIVLDRDQATGETYCIAHHLYTEHDQRKMMLAHIRYGDTFVKLDGAWLFAERNLYVDWLETRASQPKATGRTNAPRRRISTSLVASG